MNRTIQIKCVTQTARPNLTQFGLAQTHLDLASTQNPVQPKGHKRPAHNQTQPAISACNPAPRAARPPPRRPANEPPVRLTCARPGPLARTHQHRRALASLRPGPLTSRPHLSEPSYSSFSPKSATPPALLSPRAPAPPARAALRQRTEDACPPHASPLSPISRANTACSALLFAFDRLRPSPPLTPALPARVTACLAPPAVGHRS